MEIRIAIQTTEPLAGAARTERAGPLPFAGWLELLHVLSTLIGGQVGAASEQPSAAHDPRTAEDGRDEPAHHGEPDGGPHHT
jgi:hypothetical protein